MGYLGAGLPFHSSCQGLSRTHKDPQRQPGPSCLFCTWPCCRHAPHSHARDAAVAGIAGERLEPNQGQGGPF